MSQVLPSARESYNAPRSSKYLHQYNLLRSTRQSE